MTETPRFASTAVLLVAVSLIVSTGANPRKPTQGAQIRDILSFDESVTGPLNRTAAKDTRPQISQCASPIKPGADPNKGFLKEFATTNSDLHNADVPFEWAPVVRGPIPTTGDHIATTVHTPSFYAAGTVVKIDSGLIDVKFSHPFGWRDLAFDRAVDQSVDIALDSAYEFLQFPGAGAPKEKILLPPRLRGIRFHIELEAGAWPLDWLSSVHVGDRAAVIGNWILDCGHTDNWGAEIHPPVFLAFAGIEDGKTVSRVFVNPYRVTQLFMMNPARADSFTDEGRYTDRLTYPFGRFFYERIDDHAINEFDPVHVFGHAIIESTAFLPFSWYVCAPSKPEFAARLRVENHFTTRTGVTVNVTPLENLGCAMFTATMNSTYAPLPLGPLRQDYNWTWEDITTEARLAMTGCSTLDVKALVNRVVDKAIHEHLGAGPVANDIVSRVQQHVTGQTVIIDRYPPLRPLGGTADMTPGTLISDAQPFPFYGWARVYWMTSPILQPPPPVPTLKRLPGFGVDPARLDFSFSAAEQVVTVTQAGTGTPPTIQSVTIIGRDAAVFRIAKDGCSGRPVPPAGCTIAVTYLRPTGVGLAMASLHILATSGALDISLTGAPPVGASGPTPLYRLISCSTGHHFYTISAAERDNAIVAFGHQSEGVAAYIFATQAPGTTPFHRLVNPSTGDHFYTISDAERDNAIAKFGYRSEGDAGFVFATQAPGTTALHRLMNPNTGDHFYTISDEERDNAIARFGYSSEGEAGFVFPI